MSTPSREVVKVVTDDLSVIEEMIRVHEGSRPDFQELLISVGRTIARHHLEVPEARAFLEEYPLSRRAPEKNEDAVLSSLFAEGE